MAAWRQRDTNAVVERLRLVTDTSVLRLVKLKVDLGQVVELRNGIAFDLRLDAAL